LQRCSWVVQSQPALCAAWAAPRRLRYCGWPPPKGAPAPSPQHELDARSYSVGPPAARSDSCSIAARHAGRREPRHGSNGRESFQRHGPPASSAVIWHAVSGQARHGHAPGRWRCPMAVVLRYEAMSSLGDTLNSTLHTHTQPAAPPRLPVHACRVPPHRRTRTCTCQPRPDTQPSCTPTHTLPPSRTQTRHAVSWTPRWYSTVRPKPRLGRPVVTPAP
jgi:hypothetical protein